MNGDVFPSSSSKLSFKDSKRRELRTRASSSGFLQSALCQRKLDLTEKEDLTRKESKNKGKKFRWHRRLCPSRDTKIRNGRYSWTRSESPIRLISESQKEIQKINGVFRHRQQSLLPPCPEMSPGICFSLLASFDLPFSTIYRETNNRRVLSMENAETEPSKSSQDEPSQRRNLRKTKSPLRVYLPRLDSNFAIARWQSLPITRRQNRKQENRIYFAHFRPSQLSRKARYKAPRSIGNEEKHLLRSISRGINKISETLKKRALPTSPHQKNIALDALLLACRWKEKRLVAARNQNRFHTHVERKLTANTQHSRNTLASSSHAYDYRIMLK